MDWIDITDKSARRPREADWSPCLAILADKRWEGDDGMVTTSENHLWKRGYEFTHWLPIPALPVAHQADSDVQQPA